MVSLSKNQCKKRKIFNHVEVKRLLENHVAGRENNGKKIYALLWLEFWFRGLFEKDFSINPPKVFR